MFRFGRWCTEPLSHTALAAVFTEARERTQALAAVRLSELVGGLDRLLTAMSAPGPAEPRRDVSSGRWQGVPDSCAALVRAEFAAPEILDRFVELPQRSGRLRALPLGVVCHVFGPDSRFAFVAATIASLATKNVPVLLVPGSRQTAVRTFLEELQRLDEGGAVVQSVAAICVDELDAAFWPVLLDGSDAVVQWGTSDSGWSHTGGTLARNRPRLLSVPCPRYVQVISRRFWEDRDSRAAAARAQVFRDGESTFAVTHYFIQEGPDTEAIIAACSHPRTGNLEAHDDTGVRSTGANIAPTIGTYRSLDHLCELIRALPPHPTVCFTGCDDRERFDYAEGLGRAGVDRLVSIERAADPLRWEDGLRLQDLVRLVTDDASSGTSELLLTVAGHVPFYRERRPLNDPASLASWPLISGADLAREPLHRSRRMLHEDIRGGAIFSSGGTSTAPKFALYTAEEAALSAEMLARGFRANGLRPGDTALNLFVAGNLWSSFLVVHDALLRCGVFVLPMGGLSSFEEIHACLLAFRPQAVFGLPSLLVDCARHGEGKGVPVSVDRVFYAGEHLNPSARRYLSRVWKTAQFHSAGYAAVDVGPIGWQCQACKDGEHHLFAREVFLEILDEEAVVTSLVRRAMPVIRYRTGDRVHWIDGDCPCGSPEPRFRLLGRVDGQMNIWACHLNLIDVERSLVEAGMSASVFQLLLRNELTDEAYAEKLVVRMEQAAAAPDFFAAFTEKLHHHAKDVGRTLSLEQLRRHIRVDCVPPRTLPRIARTGKVKLIVDERERAAGV